MYAPNRVEKIARIMPQFSEVAEVGDEVELGLKGDPLFPDSFKLERPLATISAVDHHSSGTVVTLTHANGTNQTIQPGSLSPDAVWEFTDNTFQNVLQREEQLASRAEEPVMPEYRGVDDLRQEIAQLRMDLDAERATRLNFNNTYIETLKEMSHDIIGLSQGAEVTFANMFSQEYDRMRGETSLYDAASVASDVEIDALSEASIREDLTDYF